MVVLRDVAHEQVERIERGRVGDAGRVTKLRRTEARSGRVGLIDDGANDLRRVDGENVRRTNTVPVHVADAPPTVHDRIGRSRVGKAEAWRKVVLVWIDERTIGYRSFPGRHH